MSHKIHPLSFLDQTITIHVELGKHFTEQLVDSVFVVLGKRLWDDHIRSGSLQDFSLGDRTIVIEIHHGELLLSLLERGSAALSDLSTFRLIKYLKAGDSRDPIVLYFDRLSLFFLGGSRWRDCWSFDGCDHSDGNRNGSDVDWDWNWGDDRDGFDDRDRYGDGDRDGYGYRGDYDRSHDILWHDNLWNRVFFICNSSELLM